MEILRVTSAIILLLQFVGGQECPRQDYELPGPGYILNITSPNYPRAYRRGTACLYRITAPLDHTVLLSCKFEVYPNSCGFDSFYVAADGDIYTANRYCVSTDIRISSLFRNIAFAIYSASFTTQQGRFICRAEATRQQCQCGRSFQMKITNGEEARRHSYPYMVALRNENSPQNIFCGATIISHIHIVTAAHCMILNPDPRTIIAYVGAHDLSRPNDSPYAAQYRIRQIIIHPRYRTTPQLDLNDLALMVTQKPIEWSRGVGPICLPIRQRNNLFTQQLVDIIGWGTLSFAGMKSNTLQRAQLSVMQNDVCRRQYNASIQQEHLCSYDYRGTGQDSCQYDSGGPVILHQQGQAFLVGVISSGRACGIPRHSIGINSRVTSHIDWLLQYVIGYICAA